MSFNNSNVVIFQQDNRNVISNFNGISSVASNILTTIITYTVPTNITTYLTSIEYSGDNIAVYEIYINNILNARQRTNFGTSLNGIFSFIPLDDEWGYKLNTGDIISIKVIHERPDLGDFDARILAIEQED